MQLIYWRLCLFFNRTKARDVINITGRKLEEYIQLVSEKLTDLYFYIKRLALEMLNIKIRVDGSNVEITGTIPVADSEVVTTSS